MSNRKIIRRVKFEIFEKGYHTATQESGLYECDPQGVPTTDIFKSCINTVMVKEKIMSCNEGRKYIKGAFTGNKAEFITVKVNKRGTQKFVVMRYEYNRISRRKFKL